MNNDFRATLKALSKEAKKAAELKIQQQAMTNKQADEDVDFTKLMNYVSPIKKQQSLCPYA